jgi:fumarate reductase iron-sulfur subunit
MSPDMVIDRKAAALPVAERTIEIQVLRYRPEDESEPVIQSWRVPFTDDMSVLQGLQYIKDHLDGTLSFRWSCRMAICGSCGMMIDGKPALSCKSFLREYWPDGVRVEPLRNLPIQRDLIVDAGEFVAKLERIKPYIIPKEPRTLEQGEYLQTPAQRDLYEQYSSCINCMLCYAACPQYGLNPDFYGPGVLALMHRYNVDSRDGGRDERNEIGHSDDGYWGCTAVGYCSEVCPKGVDPANAINQNKMSSAIDWFMRFARKGGTK